MSTGHERALRGPRLDDRARRPGHGLAARRPHDRGSSPTSARRSRTCGSTAARSRSARARSVADRGLSADTESSRAAIGFVPPACIRAARSPGPIAILTKPISWRSLPATDPIPRETPIDPGRRHLHLLLAAVLVGAVACSPNEGDTTVNPVDAPFLLADVSDITQRLPADRPRARVNDTTPQMIAGTDLGLDVRCRRTDLVHLRRHVRRSAPRA